MRVLRTPDERFENLTDAGYRVVAPDLIGFGRSDKPLLAAFGDSDAGQAAERFQQEIPGAAGQPHVTLAGAGHYPRDDVPHQLAKVAIKFMQHNPVPRVERGR